MYFLGCRCKVIESLLMTRLSRYLSLVYFLVIFLLTGCLPQVSQKNTSESLKNIESQAEFYSNAIQQYASISYNEMVSSNAWRLQSIEEGLLSTRSITGISGIFLDSAYCKDSAGQNYHLTWFNTGDEGEDLALKGLGSGHSGLVNAKLKKIINGNSLGVSQGDRTIELNNGEDIHLADTCPDSVQIPRNSAVIAYELKTPVSLNIETTKNLHRVKACDSDEEEGTIVEFLQADFRSDGNIYIGDQYGPYESEAAVMEAAELDGLWNSMNGCQTISKELKYTPEIGTASAIQLQGLPANSDITAALESALTNIDCRRLLEDTETGQNENNENEVLLSTCSDGDEVPLLQNSTSRVINRTQEDVIYGCMPNPQSGTRQVTLGSAYPGVASSVHGHTATLVTSNFNSSGQVIVNKTTTEHEITIDRDPLTPGNEERRTVSEVKLTGSSINCRAENRLSATCADLYPESAALLRGAGRDARWRFVTYIDDWTNADDLVPGETKQSRATLIRQPRCDFREMRNETRTCPAGYTGDRVIEQERTWSITAIGQTLDMTKPYADVREVENNCRRVCEAQTCQVSPGASDCRNPVFYAVPVMSSGESRQLPGRLARCGSGGDDYFYGLTARATCNNGVLTCVEVVPPPTVGNNGNEGGGAGRVDTDGDGVTDATEPD